MAMHTEAVKAAQLKADEEREEMIKRNLKKMEEEASYRPEPSIADIQKATTPRPPRKVEEETEEVDPKVKKTSEPAPSSDKGGYTTRAQTAKK